MTAETQTDHPETLHQKVIQPFDDGDLVLEIDPELAPGSLIISFQEAVTLFHSGDLTKGTSGVWFIGGRNIGHRLTTRLEFVSAALALADSVDYRKAKRREKIEVVKIKMTIGRNSAVGLAPQPWSLEENVIKDARGHVIFMAHQSKGPVEEFPGQPKPDVMQTIFPTATKIINRLNKKL